LCDLIIIFSNKRDAYYVPIYFEDWGKTAVFTKKTSSEH